uniref:3-octaprenyl-4-hydroxybenzoate carboxy-lyase n=1 Tax=Pseudomonas aeruginosa TaxID=287 RepID=A0A5E5R2P4_PSEAI|nr:3-octaprenyl-4-hydroxybenzoate carboxy-lyase [Pseudomonas aeruginosa]
MNRSALDFRHFVDHLRRQGDLVDVHTEVDANLEIGAITRRVYERRAPAPLFHNIRDSLPGARVLARRPACAPTGPAPIRAWRCISACRNTAGRGTSWPRCAPRCARNLSRRAGWSAGRCRKTSGSASRWT